MKRTAGALALGLVLSLGLAGDGDAGTPLTARLAPQFPDTVAVGEPFVAALAFQNLEANPVVLRNIELVPACAGATVCPEAGVFSVSPTATGIAGPRRCRGTWTILETSPGVFRFSPPLRQRALALDPGVFCAVRFTATLLRPPTDALDEIGIQTVQVLQADRGRVAAYATQISGSDVTAVEQ